MDVPNVLYVYWKHAVTFRGDRVKSVQSLDDSTSIAANEKFEPYEIERKVKLDFHTLQASEQVFDQEYERVKELVNRSTIYKRTQHVSSKEFEV